MPKNKICIIHFQPLEKYPPVTNLLNFLIDKINNNITIDVITTRNIINLPNYQNPKFNIIRYPSIKDKESFFIKMIRYLHFYLGCLFKLMLIRPDKILYYETLSSFPAIVYYYLSLKSTEILIHYHEYSSPYEYKNGMFLTRWFHCMEQKIYPHIYCLSHTNEKRMELFKKDNAKIHISNPKIIPNYPPKAWSLNSNRISKISNQVKIIYVGSISTETMYFPEFITWIKQQGGKVLLDIYSFDYSPEFISFFKGLDNPFVKLKGQLHYNQFPDIMSDYHIGVILYKGHIPNYIYNAPNKLFEYYACGLDVWVSQEMLGSIPYLTQYTFPKVIMVDFKKMEQLDLNEALSRDGLHYKPNENFYESVYIEVLAALT